MTALKYKYDLTTLTSEIQRHIFFATRDSLAINLIKAEPNNAKKAIIYASLAVYRSAKFELEDDLTSVLKLAKKTLGPVDDNVTIRDCHNSIDNTLKTFNLKAKLVEVEVKP